VEIIFLPYPSNDISYLYCKNQDVLYTVKVHDILHLYTFVLSKQTNSRYYSNNQDKLNSTETYAYLKLLHKYIGVMDWKV